MLLLNPMTFVPNDLINLPQAEPMSPKPIMITVLLLTSWIGIGDQIYSLCFYWKCSKRFAWNKIPKTTNSARTAEKAPFTFVRGISDETKAIDPTYYSIPAVILCTHLRRLLFFAWSLSTNVTKSPPKRTMSTSYWCGLGNYWYSSTVCTKSNWESERGARVLWLNFLKSTGNATVTKILLVVYMNPIGILNKLII